MAEEKYIQFEAQDHTGKDVVIFSTSGERRSEADFEKAMSGYNKSNGYSLPASFTVLPAGSFKQIARSGYEDVNQPIQQGAQKIGTGLGAIAATSPALLLGQKLGIIPEGTAQGFMAKGSQVGQGIASMVTAPIATPEAAMGTAGGVLSALATKRGSVPVQMAGAGLGTLAGLLTGKATFGGQGNLPMDLAEASLSAATRGAFGVYQTAMGKSMSQEAQKGVAKEIGDLLKGDLAPIAKDPAVLHAYFSTPAGLSQLTQMGTKYFRQDLDSLANNIIKTVNSRAPNTLSRPAASEMRKLSEDLFDQGAIYLDALGDKGKQQAASSMMAKTHEAMRQVLRDQFPTDPQKKALANTIVSLDNAMAQHKQYLDRFNSSGEIISALKRSSIDGKFNVQAFQQEIKGYYQDNPGSLMEAAGRITQRGGPALTEQTDRALIPRMNITAWPTNMKIPIGPLGQMYTGQVQSPTGAILSGIAGRSATERSK